MECTCDTYVNTPCKGCMFFIGDLEYELIELRNGTYGIEIKKKEEDDSISTTDDI